MTAGGSTLVLVTYCSLGAEGFRRWSLVPGSHFLVHRYYDLIDIDLVGGRADLAYLLPYLVEIYECFGSGQEFIRSSGSNSLAPKISMPRMRPDSSKSIVIAACSSSI